MDRQVEKYYKKYKSGITFLLLISGLRPDYDKLPRCVRIMLSVVSSMIGFIIFLGVSAFCYSYLTNISVLSKGLDLVISFSLAFLKVRLIKLGSYYLIRKFEEKKKRNLIQLNRNLSALFEKDLILPENREHLLDLFPSFLKFFNLLYYCSGTGVILASIKPLLLAVRHGKYIRIHPMILQLSYEPGGTIQSTESAYKVIYLIVYCTMKIIQAYTYAWFGNIITVESEACLNSIYECEWPGAGDLRIMNDMLIIQSQNVMYFKVLGMMIVRLDMFSKIMHTTVS